MAELTNDELLDIAKGVEPWATWLAPGGCLESAHFELAELMRFAIAADRAARGDYSPGMVVITSDGVIAQRKEVLAAFVAKHECQPDGVVQIGNILPDGRTTWHLERRPQPTAEALQEAYAAWFKAEQHIPPSPAAARTAAAFALAVLRGEVEL